MKKNVNSYKKSGVDILLANRLIKHISKLSQKDVKNSKVSPEKDVIGGFGSLFDISNIKIKDPVIVINADSNSPHQSVINVMEAARISGLSKITFSTKVE